MTTQHPSEQEAAATLARGCTNTVEVIHWCADRVRSVDGSAAVQDAADHLHDLATRLVLDTASVQNRPAVIRWCAQEIHSMGGDADVERAADYLDDLATEALWVQHDEAVSVRQGERRRCGYTKRHPSHRFMRLEVLFQCPGQHETEGER